MDSIGIAVPLLNQARFVRATIESIQRLRVPFDAIIQDGGSTDGTLEIVEKLVSDDSRFTIVSEEDRGQADAIQRAWAHLLPSHEWVTWVNGDDIVHSRGVEAELELVRRRPDTVVAYGAFLLIDEHGEIQEFIRRPPRLRRVDLVYLDSLVPGVAMLCRSATVRNVGGLDTSLHYAMDHDLFIRMAEHGSLRGVRQPSFSFRAHSDAKTTGHEDASRHECERVSSGYRRVPAPIGGVIRTALRVRARLSRMVGTYVFVERYGSH